MDSYGVAVVPGVLKAGIVVGGRYGQGILSVRITGNAWSNPVFLTLTGASFGFQAGIQATDVIFVFKSRKSVDGILNGKITLGANASVAAGPLGREAIAATDLHLTAEIYSYSKSRGFFAGVSLDGTILQIDQVANRAFYQSARASANDIIQNRIVAVPEAAEDFKRLLSSYANVMKKEAPKNSTD